MSMKLVVPTELYENESRVSITPDIIPSLIKMGFKVFVQSNAGLGSSYTDEDYKKSGAVVSSKLNELYSKADLVIKVQRPFKQKQTDEFNYTLTPKFSLNLSTPHTKDVRKNNAKINFFAADKKNQIFKAPTI